MQQYFQNDLKEFCFYLCWCIFILNQMKCFVTNLNNIVIIEKSWQRYLAEISSCDIIKKNETKDNHYCLQHLALSSFLQPLMITEIFLYVFFIDLIYWTLSWISLNSFALFRPHIVNYHSSKNLYKIYILN